MKERWGSLLRCHGERSEPSQRGPNLLNDGKALRPPALAQTASPRGLRATRSIFAALGSFTSFRMTVQEQQQKQYQRPTQAKEV